MVRCWVLPTNTASTYFHGPAHGGIRYCVCQIRCESGPFVPLSTLFPDARSAFMFIPDLAVAAPPPPLPSPIRAPPAAIPDEVARLTAQLAALDADVDMLNKYNQELGQAYARTSAMQQHAVSIGEMDQAAQLYHKAQQEYAKLVELHTELGDKTKSQAALRLSLQEAHYRQASGGKVAQAPAPQPSATAAAAAALQQQRVREQAEAERAQKAAAAAKAIADAEAASLAAQREAAAAAREKAERDARVVVAPAPAVEPSKPATAWPSHTTAVSSKPAVLSFASALNVSVRDPVPAPAPAPAVAVVTVAVQPEEPAKPSLLEVQAAEAARKMGIVGPRPTAVVAPTEPAVDSAEAPAASVWNVSHATSKPTTSKSLAQIQVRATIPALPMTFD